ncbi:MAG TPA: hypothetical protein PLJ37_00750 [Chitinophagales bacterium]|nr:hypothetical protein [Chitinophagales bacterium]HMW93480.1 hypothetical protein [Chitinophagales bacterium]HMZ92897.1 hypothetical protein [Chitinophagales bacterium]HNG25914.1 hypothetical protein [Chitinophagales bacterium]
MKNQNYTIETLIKELQKYPKDLQVFIDSELTGELKEIWDIFEFYTDDDISKVFNCQEYSYRRKNKKQIKVLVLRGNY